ncbi:MAG TPA: chemotaxis protein CheB [Povalibacter sp.]
MTVPPLSQPAATDHPQIAAVVIGGSAGALDVVRSILGALPSSVAVPVVIVLHLSATAHDTLPAVLRVECALPVKYAEDKEPAAAGIVYVAPPAYHLLIESQQTFALSVDDPVHFSRPSIDVMFESACDAYGARLLAILLSGASDDGAAGLREIASRGGTTIVQNPVSAAAPAMPAAALARFQPAFIWTPLELTQGLPALITRTHSPQPGESVADGSCV